MGTSIFKADRVGNLADLDTTDKSSAVAAINEVDRHADTAQSTADAAQQMIAPIQRNLTASKAYAVGEQFVYNGLLYKATATIVQGGTITINGNCALADNVTKQIGALGVTVNPLLHVHNYISRVTGGWTRIGNVVIVSMYIYNVDTFGIAVYTLGDGFPRPVSNVVALSSYENAHGLEVDGYMYINSDGQLLFDNRVAADYAGRTYINSAYICT